MNSISDPGNFSFIVRLFQMWGKAEYGASRNTTLDANLGHAEYLIKS